jgi:hypothetical protein
VRGNARDGLFVIVTERQSISDGNQSDDRKSGPATKIAAQGEALDATAIFERDLRSIEEAVGSPTPAATRFTGVRATKRIASCGRWCGGRRHRRNLGVIWRSGFSEYENQSPNMTFQSRKLQKLSPNMSFNLGICKTYLRI